MFKCFNLTSITADFFHEESRASWAARGRSLFREQSQVVRSGLEDFVTQQGGALDGNRLQDYWFPQIDADVFLSHAHRDETVAVTLAGWLHDELKVKTFIDSCVWGYAEDLLKRIDDRYCRLNAEDVTYSYEKRNRSTSHVHMMLSTALTSMIDRTECLIFLNTPQAITAGQDATSTTQSPWLFAEIATARVVRERIPRRLVMLAEKRASLHYDAGPSVEYRVDLEHLTDIYPGTLRRWQASLQPDAEHALDALYRTVLQQPTVMRNGRG